MKFTENTLIDFVVIAVDFFDWEDLQEEDYDVEITEDDETGFVYSDVVRAADEAVYRFFVAEGSIDLNIDLPDCFELFRELESEHDDHAAVLCWRGTEDAEGEDFWYMQRNESGEIGVFHSDLSLDEDDEEDEDEEEESEAAGL